MAFGKHKVEAEYPPVEATDSAVLDKTTTQAYPGFLPQRYISPLIPVMDVEQGEVDNNVERGTEAHGLYVDSHVHPKNIELLDYARTSDDVDVINPQYDPTEDKYPPLAVRIVDQKPVELTRINVAVYPITGTTPVRILGQDDKRVRALVGTSGTVTGTLYLLTDVNSTPALSGFPLPSATAQPMEVRGDQELWVSGGIGTDTGSVAVYVERIINGDSEHPSN